MLCISDCAVHMHAEDGRLDDNSFLAGIDPPSLDALIVIEIFFACAEFV